MNVCECMCEYMQTESVSAFVYKVKSVSTCKHVTEYVSIVSLCACESMQMSVSR